MKAQEQGKIKSILGAGASIKSRRQRNVVTPCKKKKKGFLHSDSHCGIEKFHLFASDVIYCRENLSLDNRQQ